MVVHRIVEAGKGRSTLFHLPGAPEVKGLASLSSRLQFTDQKLEVAVWDLVQDTHLLASHAFITQQVLSCHMSAPSPIKSGCGDRLGHHNPLKSSSSLFSSHLPSFNSSTQLWTPVLPRSWTWFSDCEHSETILLKDCASAFSRSIRDLLGIVCFVIASCLWSLVDPVWRRLLTIARLDES